MKPRLCEGVKCNENARKIIVRERIPGRVVGTRGKALNNIPIPNDISPLLYSTQP